jgi:hypothetical protein
VKLTRRNVAKGVGGAVMATPLAFSGPSMAQVLVGAGLRVRRSLSGMAYNDPDLEALRYAIGQMRTTAGPLSWLTQRQVHAAPWGHHNSWRFLPWHRFQLYYLERIIARISGKPDFAMPYWNWDDDRAPAAYFQRRSPLYDNTRTINASSRISSYIGFEWAAGAGDGDFWGRTDNEFGDFFGSQNPTGEAGAGYAGSAEQYGHNLVHLFCGGRMRNLMESPLDPLFWAHHSNVDRQWAIWTEIHGAKNYPREWGAEPCTGYVDADGYLAPARFAAECADTRPMGYTYDNLNLAARALQRERWPGAAEPTPAPVIQRSFQAQRASPSLMRIFVPSQAVSNLKGAYGPSIDATGLIQIIGMDGFVVRIASRSTDGSFVFGQDAIFSVPMGGGGPMGMHPVGHRVQLNRLVPRDARALSEGFWIEADANRLRGERTGMQPEVASFAMNYRSQL